MRRLAPVVVLLFLLVPHAARAEGGTMVEPVIPGRGATFDGGPTFALGGPVLASASPLAGMGGPAATLYVRLGEDVSASLRHRALGGEGLGSEVDARVAVSRSLGRFDLVANAMIGQGLGVRDDVDFEAGALATVRVAPRLSFGGEARARGELVDRVATLEDAGRPLDFVAGALVAADVADVTVRALGGWQVPRGLATPGPAALVTAAIVF